MLLKAFRNSPLNSRFMLSVNLTFFTILKSVRKAGPLSTRLWKPHVPAKACAQFHQASRSDKPSRWCTLGEGASKYCTGGVEGRCC